MNKSGFQRGHGSLRTRESYKRQGEKISKSLTGKKLSESHRKNISIAHKGKPLSEKQKISLQKALLNRWFGHIKNETKRYIHLCNTKEYRDWRSIVFQNDGWSCHICRSKGYIEAHHIKSWAKHPELRYDPKNGIALCLKCHSLTENYKNKKQK